MLWSHSHRCGQSFVSDSALAAEEGSASFPHKGRAALTEAAAAFVTDIHSRSVKGENATRTRLLFRVEPDLQALSSSSPV